MSRTTIANAETTLANGSARRATQVDRPDKLTDPENTTGSPAAVSTTKAARPKKTTLRGLSFQRYFTPRGIDPLSNVTWERRSSVITNPDGSVVFKMDGVEIPSAWSQLATDIVVSKYFRKAGLHGRKESGEKVYGRSCIDWHTPSARPATASVGTLLPPRTPTLSRLTSRTFSLTRYGAFNSPVWFNCGLYHAYGITGTGGDYAWNERSKPQDPAADTSTRTAYERPQCSACFIQSVSDDLMSIVRSCRKERGSALQVRLGHRNQFQSGTRQARKAFGRGHKLRSHELPGGI